MAKRKRISFDPVDPALVRVLSEICEEFDIPPGDLLNYATIKLLLAVANGEEDFTDLMASSRLPRYGNRLELSELVEEMKKRLGR